MDQSEGSGNGSDRAQRRRYRARTEPGFLGVLGSKSKPGTLLIGKDIDQSSIDPGLVITSVILDYGLIMGDIIPQVTKGAPGGFYASSVAKGAIYITPPASKLTKPETATKAEAVKKDIAEWDSQRYGAITASSVALCRVPVDLHSDSQMEHQGVTTVRMEGITKHFPGSANDGINLELRQGEVHRSIGKNGSGKTTLMSILYGLWQPDQGQIHVDNKRVVFASPQDAIRHGISMVHQDFMLVPPLTVVENVILGAEPRHGYFIDLDGAKQQIEELSAKFGLKVNSQTRIWQLSAGQQQRVEIIKALYRGANVLILDEPASVLASREQAIF
jgi:ABC-type lipoprotein export system ATPase subunit